MRVVLGLSTILILASCSHRPTRAPAHDGATPVASTSPLPWVSIARTPKRDALATRVQAWADLIDAAVRADAPLAPTPRPLIEVTDFPASEARVIGALVCLLAPTTVASTRAASSKSNSILVLERNTYRVRDRANCQTGGAAEFAAWISSLGYSCRVTNESGVLTVRGCTGKAPNSEFRGVGYYATSNVIQVSAKWIAGFTSEDAMVGALAHTLGHYYRAHLIGGRDGYWYQVESPPRPGRPLKLARSGEYARTLTRLQKALESGAENAEQEYQEFTASLSNERIRHYGIENEAWDFAIEYVSKIGIEPSQIGVDSDYEVAAHGWRAQGTKRPEFTESWDSYRIRALARVAKASARGSQRASEPAIIN